MIGAVIRLVATVVVADLIATQIEKSINKRTGKEIFSYHTIFGQRKF